MKRVRHLLHRLGCLFVLATATGTLATASTAYANTPSKQCYPVTYDRDRDGYADLGVLKADDERFAFPTDSLNCPAGYVSKANDCNDLVSSIHPGRSEVGYNGIDDNCNDKVDEPTFEYFPDGNLNTTTSFRMSVFLNHPDVLNAGLTNTLYAEVRYSKLSNSANQVTLPRAHVLSYGGAFNALLSLWSLDPSTVYRTSVTFYKKLSNFTYQQVGPSSDGYYTMTDGTAGKPHTRALMVLKGLKEYSESGSEKVGYRGTVAADGTRYGADPNEQWCSEFYVWVTQSWMRGVAGIDYWSRLIDYFEGYDSYYPASEIPSRAAPGDYLPLDTDKDGEINHSAMFLAYDSSQSPPLVWMLEGNHGNKVAVVKREFDSSPFKVVNTGVATFFVSNNPVFRGLGYIVSSMLQ